MTADCRPPPGTPDGTVCNLQWHDYKEKPWPGLDRAVWRQTGWKLPGSKKIWPTETLTNYGWRFHSVADV